MFNRNVISSLKGGEEEGRGRGPAYLPPEVVLLVENPDDVPTSEGHACILGGDQPVLTRVIVKVSPHELLGDASSLLVPRLNLH